MTTIRGKGLFLPRFQKAHVSPVMLPPKRFILLLFTEKFSSLLHAGSLAAPGNSISATQSQPSIGWISKLYHLRLVTAVKHIDLLQTLHTNDSTCISTRITHLLFRWQKTCRHLFPVYIQQKHKAVLTWCSTWAEWRPDVKVILLWPHSRENSSAEFKTFRINMSWEKKTEL